MASYNWFDLISCMRAVGTYNEKVLRILIFPGIFRLSLLPKVKIINIYGTILKIMYAGIITLR